MTTTRNDMWAQRMEKLALDWGWRPNSEVPADFIERLVKKLQREATDLWEEYDLLIEERDSTWSATSADSVDAYISALDWTAAATEWEKTLVVGNVRAFASHLRRHPSIASLPTRPLNPGAAASVLEPYASLIRCLREPVDEGGYDGFHPDPQHVSAARAIEELAVALASQIEIANDLRRRLETWERSADSTVSEHSEIRSES